MNTFESNKAKKLYNGIPEVKGKTAFCYRAVANQPCVVIKIGQKKSFRLEDQIFIDRKIWEELVRLENKDTQTYLPRIEATTVGYTPRPKQKIVAVETSAALTPRRLIQAAAIFSGLVSVIATITMF